MKKKYQFLVKCTVSADDAHAWMAMHNIIGENYRPDSIT